MKTTKYIYFIKALLVFITSVQIISCSNDDEVTEPQIITEPGKSELVLPINNTECEVGEIIANKAAVFFEWNASVDTENYDLEITNLITREITKRPNLVTTSKEVKLERGFPYSWIVTSKNSGELVTVSDVSKFYLAGEAGSNNVPFPASLLSPLSGITIAPVDGKVTLEWESSNKDTDGDELTFDVFVDTVDGNQATPEDWKGLTDTSIEIFVESNTWGAHVPRLCFCFCRALYIIPDHEAHDIDE